jgi:preprotein translocase subunit SecE
VAIAIIRLQQETTSVQNAWRLKSFVAIVASIRFIEKQNKIGGVKVKFLKSVVQEMKKVSWPTKQQLRKFTFIVFETTILFALIFWIFDTAIKGGFNLILK